MPDKRMLASLVTLLAALLLSGCASATEAGAEAKPTMTDQELAGRTLFTQHCSSCHSTLPDTVIVGPSLDNVASRAASRVQGMDAHDYLATSITDPDAYVVDGYNDLMPPTLHELLDDGEIDSLVAYLMTLKE